MVMAELIILVFNCLICALIFCVRLYHQVYWKNVFLGRCVIHSFGMGIYYFVHLTFICNTACTIRRCNVLNGENSSGNQKTVNLKIVEASGKYAQLLHLRKKIIQCKIGISMCNCIFRFRHEKTRRRSLWRNMSNMIIYSERCKERWYT